ncbi:MAG: hypothetical protein A2137_00085 [Chloroflexi bacterium RBG_16_58_8]|nr:MAG: hypothetical protein A2137_00085 [Chloroflexi bacterium RBG_16_58_8]
MIKIRHRLPDNLDKWILFYYNTANWHYFTIDFSTMIIKTRVFDMANGKYPSLAALAGAMGLSVSQVYRVREGKRGINEKFIVGAKKAFPDSRLEELFYFNTGQSSGHTPESSANSRYDHIVRRFTAADV